MEQTRQKLALFSFNKDTSEYKVYLKFIYFARSQYPRYFKGKDAPFHKEMILNTIRAYRGQQNFLNIAFRGSAKRHTQNYLSLFILNDEDTTRKYIKVLTKDLKTQKQVVTDVYNLIVEVQTFTVIYSIRKLKRK